MGKEAGRTSCSHRVWATESVLSSWLPWQSINRPYGPARPFIASLTSDRPSPVLVDVYSYQGVQSHYRKPIMVACLISETG